MTQHDTLADFDAEEQVLGALLIAGSYSGDTGPAENKTFLDKIRRIVDSSCFYRDRHGWIFAAMLSIAERGCGGDTEVRSVNQITVAHQLGFEGKLKACGGAAYLSHLIANCATTVYAEDYARIVKDMAARRGQIVKAKRIEEDAYKGTTKPNQAAKGGVHLIPME